MGKEWQWSRGSRKDEKEVVPGCMSGMMHFFDFHQLLFTTSTCTRPPQEEAAAAAAGSSPQNQQNYSAAQLKGLEAPRNSLELDEDVAAKASASAATADDYFGIPLAPAPSPVKKKKKEEEEEEEEEEELHFLQVEEERRSSQAVTPRTPNLVARLMGLEILPDEFFTPTAGSVSVSLQHSPKITPKSSSKKVKKKKNNSDHESRGESTPPPPARQPLQRRDCNIPSHGTPAGSRSLPETPRASSERYRDADPRLSLQLNKENSSRSAKEYNYPAEAPGEHSLPPSPSPLHTTNARRKDCLKVHDENKSPRGRHYAREIVKQVKESISRRGSSGSGSSSDEHLLKSRRTRTSAEKNALGNNIDSTNSAAKPSPSLSPPPPPLLCRPSCSPEFDIPRPQQIPRPSPSANPSPSSSTSSFSYAAAAARDYAEAKGSKMGSTKCQRASYERFTERIKRHSTPPPADVLASPALSSPSNMAAVRRRKFEASQENRRRSPPEPLVHPSSPTLANLEEKLLNGSVKPLALSNQTSKDQNPEFHYVRSILGRAGIMGTSQQAYRWFSPSLPIHPFVFHQLELDLPFFPRGPVRHRCNRKLLFHLVDEILGELVGWSATRSFTVDRELLLERLWSRIRSFPSANCQVIGDIDVLVAGDLTETRVKRLLQHPSVVAEAEDIALEIEQDVLDSILGEAAASFAGN